MIMGGGCWDGLTDYWLTVAVLLDVEKIAMGGKHK
jgi:hypothetical protein